MALTHHLTCTPNGSSTIRATQWLQPAVCWALWLLDKTNKAPHGTLKRAAPLMHSSPRLGGKLWRHTSHSCRRLQLVRHSAFEGCLRIPPTFKERPVRPNTTDYRKMPCPVTAARQATRSLAPWQARSHVFKTTADAPAQTILCCSRCIAQIVPATTAETAPGIPFRSQALQATRYPWDAPIRNRKAQCYDDAPTPSVPIHAPSSKPPLLEMDSR